MENRSSVASLHVPCVDFFTNFKTSALIPFITNRRYLDNLESKGISAFMS